MSRLNVANFRHPDGTADNITFDSSTNATVAGNLTASGNSTVTGNLTVNGTGNQSIAGTLQFNSGYGSAATAYGVRAFAVFDGTTPGSPDITRNVSTIGDTATGRFTINFTNEMPDIHYAMAGSAGNHGTTGSVRGIMPDDLFTTSSAAIRAAYAQQTAVDDDYIAVMFVR